MSAALAASACTSILGIDGDYYADRASSGGSTSGGKTSASGGKTENPPTTGGTTNSPHHDAGVSGGAVGKGGTQPSMGGVTTDSSTGGKTNEGSGGTETGSGGTAAGGATEAGGSGGASGAAGAGASTGSGGSGGTPPEDAGVCPTGTLSGTYSGAHHPSTGGTAVPAPLAGNISLRLTTASSTTRMITGTLTFPIGAAVGGLAGTFLGTFDCNKGTGSYALLDLPYAASVTTIVPPEAAVQVDGTITVQLDTNGGLKGTFSIHETVIVTATGSGTWSAK
ncbi:MAG TPA: hypothetical protein VHC69_09500 [Polyangiaceae bacterium]|nr:hypothetical protein [Polyangiaceae bacterium]